VNNFEINTRAQTSSDFIKNVRAFQKSVKINEYFGDESKVPEVDTTSFNINVYMNLFNRLKVDSGKVCCLIGVYDNRAGGPLLSAPPVCGASTFAPAPKTAFLR